MSETDPPDIVSADELARIRQREYEATYTAWFAAMSPQEQAQMREMGLALPVMDGLVAHAARDDGEHERPEIGEASTLIDGLEPLTREPGMPVLLVDGLGDAMAWVTEPEPLVQVGIRACVMVHVMYPKLMPVGQLRAHGGLVGEFSSVVGPDHGGQLYGAFLEWVRRGATFSQIGQRFLVSVYVTSPKLIDSPTLETLGKMNDKTRQAWDKLVQDFRDTFDGIRSRMMRGDETRIACRDAQLSRSL